MDTRELSVTEASENFADLVDQTFLSGESTVLLRSGEPVVMICPIEEKSITGLEWLKKWEKMPHLDLDDAIDFAKTIEDARNQLPTPISAWD